MTQQLAHGRNYPLEEIKNATIQNNGIVQPQENAYTTFIREVQSCIGAKVDGIAGPETLSKTVTISKTKNKKHPVVRAVQKYLISLGYNLSKYGADGDFGNETDNAVRQFQKDNGCVQDGEITARNKTWKKLLKLL